MQVLVLISGPIYCNASSGIPRLGAQIITEDMQWLLKRLVILWPVAMAKG